MARPSIRAGFGTYYSLLDSSKLNELPPFNGTLAFSNVALSSIVPIIPGTPPQPSVRAGSACKLHDLFSAGRSARREDSYRGTMEFQSRARVEFQHRAPRRVCRIVWLPRFDQYRSKQHSRSDMRQSGRLRIRRKGSGSGHGCSGRLNTYRWEPGRIRIFPAAFFGIPKATAPITLWSWT